MKDGFIHFRKSLAAARALTDGLFAMLRPEALYKRPIAERHRLIFYLGHLEAFDLNLLRERGGEKSFNREFDQLFAFGIDPLDSLPSDRVTDWPPESAVKLYQRRAREAVDRSLRDDGGDLTPYFVALEHRLMHAETFAYLLHRLPAEDKLPVHENVIDTRSPETRTVVIPKGSATLGRRREESGFGWDNEYATQTVTVPAFEIDVNDVTNEQFLQFVLSGAYEERSLWDNAAWDWIQKEGIAAPNFWRKTSNGWMYQTMFGAVPLPMSWPVYVSHAEAAAYARWKHRQLPTEEQYHRAAFSTGQEGVERLHPWGDARPVAGFRGTFGTLLWNPLPVASCRANYSAWGVADLMSNGWKWTSSVFAPLPGFQPLPSYPQYSADFFDGRHYVLKGASPRTPASLVRRSFRNWFQPHYSNIYATFRCVDN